MSEEQVPQCLPVQPGVREKQYNDPRLFSAGLASSYTWDTSMNSIHNMTHGSCYDECIVLCITRDQWPFIRIHLPLSPLNSITAFPIVTRELTISSNKNVIINCGM